MPSPILKENQKKLTSPQVIIKLSMTMHESLVQQMLAQIERAIRLLFTVGVTLNVILALVNSILAGFLTDRSSAKLWLIFSIFLGLGLLFNILCIVGIQDRKIKREQLLESFWASQESADPRLYESLRAGANTAVLTGILLILGFIALGVPIIILTK